MTAVESGYMRVVRSVALALLLGLLVGGATALVMLHRAAGLAVLCLVISVLPIIVRVAQRRFDPFEPIQIIAITFLVIYGIRPGAELIFGIKSFANQYSRDGFDSAALISAVGMLCLYLGYALVTGMKMARRTPSPQDMWDAERSVRFGIWVLVVSGLLTAAFAATIGPSALFHFFLGRSTTTFQTALQVSGYVALGPYLTIPAAFIFMFAYARLRTFKTLLLFLVSLSVAVFISFPQGDRTYVLALVLPLLMIPYLRKGIRPGRIAVLVALLGAVLGMNVLVAERNIGQRQPVLTAVGDAITHMPTQLKKFATGTDIAEFSVLELEAEEYNSRFNPLTYHPGQTLICAIAYWIPRKLLPNKPQAASQMVDARLFPYTVKTRASFNPAIFGDFYADDGWLTMVLYDIIVGIIVRFIWEYFKRHERSEGVQILYAATVPILVIMIRNNVVDAFARSLFLSGPLLLCLLVCSRERMRRFAGYRVTPAFKRAVGVRPE